MQRLGRLFAVRRIVFLVPTVVDNGGTGVGLYSAHDPGVLGILKHRPQFGHPPRSVVGLDDDISIMPEDWFPQVAGQRQSDYNLDDGFCTMHDQTAKLKSNGGGSAERDYSKMPNDVLIKFYYSMLGLLGIYILLKMMMKKKIKG